MNQQFPKSFRLLSKADFSSMRKGRRISYGAIRLVYLDNKLGFSRLGLAVSRKYGNAVQRNRFKRQLRDTFRTGDYHQMSVDVLAIPMHSAEKVLRPAHDFQMALGKIQRS